MKPQLTIELHTVSIIHRPNHFSCMLLEIQSHLLYNVVCDYQEEEKEWSRKIYRQNPLGNGTDPEKLVYRDHIREKTWLPDIITFVTAYLISNKVAYNDTDTATFYCQLFFCGRLIEEEADYCTQYDCPHRKNKQ